MKKSVVAVYESHEKAIRAVTHLIKHDIPESHLSIVGHGDIVEDHIHIVEVKNFKLMPGFVGAGVGGVLGFVAGAADVPIPGVAFLTEAGGLPGLLGGIAVGIAVGALISIAVSLAYRKDDLVLFKKHVEKGKYLVVVNGENDEIDKSRKLLHTENEHLEIHDILVK